VLLVLALPCIVAGGIALAGYLLRDGDARAYRQAGRCPADAPAPDCYILIQTVVTDVAVTRPPLRQAALLDLQLASIEGRVRLEEVTAPPPVGKQVSARRWRGAVVLVWIDGQPLETAANPAYQQRIWRLGTLPLALGLVLLSIHNLLPRAKSGGGRRAKEQRRSTTG
jgi:hypothetical protein